MKQHRNILLILLLAASALAVFGASFQIGKMLSLAYKRTTAQAPSPKNVSGSGEEMPPMAAAPKADGPAVKEEAKSGAGDSAPMKIVEPAPGKVGKAGTPAPEKSVAQRPAETVAAPVAKDAKAEKPAAAAKPAATAPAASVPAFPAATKPPEPAPEQKPEAKAPKKLKEYKVVAASFSTEADAGRLVNRLTAENYKPIVVAADLPKGRYYRVIVGSHGSLSEARGEMAELKKLGLQPFCIVE